MKKTIAALLCMIICIGLLAGCGGKTEGDKTSALATPAPESIGQTNTAGSSTAESIATPPPKDAEYYTDLSLYIDAKVAIIDPLNVGSQTTQSGLIANMIYDNLVEYTIDCQYAPSLATEWSTEDYQTYTFKLRDDVKFHNGEPFTADDVVFTAEAAKEVVGSGIYNTFGQVAEVKAVNDHEVVMTLQAKNIDFIYNVSSPMAPILNRDAYESGDEHAGWIGTGAFSVVDMVPNDSITYKRNDEYWGEPALCENFVMRYIAEETARNIMLENDEFTFANVSGVYIPKYSANDRFVITSYVMDNCNYIGFNMRKPITGDVNFRKAVSYAIDREAILDVALDGYGKAAETGALWGNNTAYKDRSIEAPAQDYEKAKEYLAKSCYNGEEVELAASMSHTIKTAQLLQEELKMIGVNAKVHEYDGPSMTSATLYESNNCDIVVGSGSWSPLASSCKAFLIPGSNSNKACYDNPEVTALIEEAAGTPDGPEREAMYFKIQQIIADEVPYIPTFHMALYIGAQKGSGGVLYFPTNHHDYSHAYRMKLE